MDLGSTNGTFINVSHDLHFSSLCVEGYVMIGFHMAQ